MTSLPERITLPRQGGNAGLMWAFVERQTNLWKRYWAWELVWLVYGVVNTLAITFIAKEAEQAGVNTGAPPPLVFFFLGTPLLGLPFPVVAVIKLPITLERSGSTVERTIIAPL